MRDKVIEIIHEINPYVDITDSTDLIGEGILDSLGLVLLLQLVEENIGVRIPQDIIELSDFCNIESILNTIKEKGIK